MLAQMSRSLEKTAGGMVFPYLWHTHIQRSWTQTQVIVLLHLWPREWLCGVEPFHCLGHTLVCVNNFMLFVGPTCVSTNRITWFTTKITSKLCMGFVDSWYVVSLVRLLLVLWLFLQLTSQNCIIIIVISITVVIISSFIWPGEVSSLRWPPPSFADPHYWTPTGLLQPLKPLLVRINIHVLQLRSNDNWGFPRIRYRHICPYVLHLRARYPSLWRIVFGPRTRCEHLP